MMADVSIWIMMSEIMTAAEVTQRLVLPTLHAI